MDSQVLILGLHRVGIAPKHAKIRGLFTSPKLLAFQLSLIQKMGFEFTTLKNALAKPNGKKAVLTFDDGYEDNITNALPVLQEFGAPATLFVITGDVGRKNVVWKEASEDLPADLLSWKSIERLAGLGWEIGSHCHEHIHLARYNRAEQEKTIARSIKEIKANLGINPVSFAYPYGSYNEDAKNAVRNNGLRYAVTTNPSKIEDTFATGDLLEVPRVSVGGRSFHHYFKTMRKYKKALGSANIFKSLVKTRFEPGFQDFLPITPIEEN